MLGRRRRWLREMRQTIEQASGMISSDVETKRVAQYGLDQLTKLCHDMIQNGKFGKTTLTYIWEAGKIQFVKVDSEATEKRQR